MPLLAYDAAGNVIGTLDQVIVRTGAGPFLVDFAAHEEANGEHTDIWQVDGAAGSKVWPERLGKQAHGFRVEIEGPAGAKHIAALVHRESGHRRERSEATDRPIILDDKGRDASVVTRRPTLPLLRIGRG